MRTASALTARLCASADVFNHEGRRPWACINFVTAHDGFTLNDLVTYNDKHNEANGEDNKDGNFEQPLMELRRRRSDGRSRDQPAARAPDSKSCWPRCCLSQGTPMLLAGDEFGRTQQGNNNAYCQDNEISWVNWELAKQNEFADQLRPEAHPLAAQVSGSAP